MLSSLLERRSQRQRNQINRSSISSSHSRTASPPPFPPQDYDRRNSLRYTTQGESQNESSQDEADHFRPQRETEDDITDESEQEEETTTLLPLFDATQLETLPVYALTHAIRLLVSSKCDTVLTWDQLRSPQVSQFLLKPIHQEILSNHFSAATMYCLMANCLQFTREMDMYPANSGTMQTRAMVCELLAIKLLKDYQPRALIDACSYDFDPLQGQEVDNPPQPHDHRQSWQSTARRAQPRSARISCLEVAILAEGKQFLAHPQVVQQLEAIWDGSIVFHTTVDGSLRNKDHYQTRSYGTSGVSQPSMPKTNPDIKPQLPLGYRRVVMLYNPRDASLFKLSRLRVPRYRNILSTLSFAILLALFVAVLKQRSTDITPLEVLFWFWAAGYMMDELVGFTEQGFGLYLASFWNTIDLGIVLILIAHLCLRIYGIVKVDVGKKQVANMAYDLLAADAILLFPRLFSVLDHYRYFSQLIVAFRLMAADLVVVLVLMAISCSGFFVALSLSFGNDGNDSAPDVAYALFQMIMGFTPAVWDRWAGYTLLGRFILILFLTLAHFLIITMLIAVLSNSFMTVIRNANEEHQFIFAVNTISSVKSRSLFAYVPPLNVLQWTLAPLRYTLPSRQYHKINKMVIKITHFPILLLIYLYERVIAQTAAVGGMGLINRHKRGIRNLSQRLPRMAGEPAVRQGMALEEVFRQPNAGLKAEMMRERKRSTTVVKRWMRDMDGGHVTTPQDNDPKTMDRLDKRRLKKKSISKFSKIRPAARQQPSAASNPVETMSKPNISQSGVRTTLSNRDGCQQRESDAHDTADGDDEMYLVNNDGGRTHVNISNPTLVQTKRSNDYFSPRPPVISKRSFQASSLPPISQERQEISKSGRGSPSTMSFRKRPWTHLRNASSATMIYKPPAHSIPTEDKLRNSTGVAPIPLTPGSRHPSSGGKNTPRPKQISRVRSNFPNRQGQPFRSTPDLQGLLPSSSPRNTRRPTLEMDLVSDIGDNKAIGGGYVGAIPASFANQFGALQTMHDEQNQEQQMFGRLMMARMNTLEEGFRDVIHEMRESMRSFPGSRARSPERPAQERRERRAAVRSEVAREKERERTGSKVMGSDSSDSVVLNQPVERGLSGVGITIE